MTTKFFADEMLARLGRYLRAAGYDTRIAAGGLPNREIVRAARAENRVIVTRHRKILEFKGAFARCVVVDGNSVAAQARSLAAAVEIDWLVRPFSRCLACNAILEAADEEQAARVPERARAAAGPLTWCPACDKVFWPGSHYRRMAAILARWNSGDYG